MLGSAPPFSSSSTACVEEAAPVLDEDQLWCSLAWNDKVYQVVSGCYGEREGWVSAPEQVCAGTVWQQEGHNFAGILGKTMLSEEEVGKFAASFMAVQWDIV